MGAVSPRTFPSSPEMQTPKKVMKAPKAKAKSASAKQAKIKGQVQKKKSKQSGGAGASTSPSTTTTSSRGPKTFALVKKRPSMRTPNDSGSEHMVNLDSDFEDAELSYEERHQRARVMVYRDWVDLRDYNSSYGCGVIDFHEYLASALKEKGFQKESPKSLREKYPLGPDGSFTD